ncbi:hypothetical protein MtrunA17_Chr3g0082461 [Medicago truncatula]|uniref:Transmembrane protein, putative n=1 Tax=Medicago truncatula TaxID=3880 RepID=A0A072UVB8_MEDTR|nr:transmembrane protein, putative [Medicago truncatula]RHN65669.1 hypothetical protein MtrunA17_Chr3g0082461 [Medicago truncatula]
MASFFSYLLVFFFAFLILIPQGFGNAPNHNKHLHHPSSTYVHPTTLPKPTYPASTNIPKKHPHHPPKEDNTHF